jgi:hypothetical protein
MAISFPLLELRQLLKQMAGPPGAQIADPAEPKNQLVKIAEQSIYMLIVGV